MVHLDAGRVRTRAGEVRLDRSAVNVLQGTVRARTDAVPGRASRSAVHDGQGQLRPREILIDQVDETVHACWGRVGRSEVVVDSLLVRLSIALVRFRDLQVRVRDSQ
jgi:hypothetical protein